MKDQRPQLEWRENVPVAVRFEDPYFSLQNGLEETRHVFLAGNGLPERFSDGFHIAELGFGTGLNCVAALAAWRAFGQAGKLHFTSFEMYPMEPGQMRRALSVYPEIAGLAEPLLAQIEAAGSYSEPVEVDGLSLRVIVGDARDSVPHWSGQADAWFLDGFAPARNPELWEPALLTEVARHTAKGGTAATYSAAGAVRRALEAAGFEVSRVPGFGRKRHMTVARLP